MDGIKTRIHEWGNRENPTIVCLHGLGSTSLSFIELAEMLRNKYHLLSIDLPGHGGTSPLLHLKDYGPATMNRFINQVVSLVTDQTFFLLAQSFGADIALHDLAAYPKNVKKTLLLDGGYYVKKDSYAYDAANEGAIYSLQKEIDYYVIDFDEYKVDSMEANLKIEKVTTTDGHHY
ncbi:MAG: alpha/beta fold hydrolase [Turicibacter sp.]